MGSLRIQKVVYEGANYHFESPYLMKTSFL